ncbi:hypothetical protein N836_11495 [Leptolyngbya sp. Heron Island J]|nr:hypothetical protein N836_11495 [Leptolyngbya sp. Heron Island J]
MVTRGWKISKMGNRAIARGKRMDTHKLDNLGAGYGWRGV